MITNTVQRIERFGRCRKSIRRDQLEQFANVSFMEDTKMSFGKCIQFSFKTGKIIYQILLSYVLGFDIPNVKLPS